LNIAEKRGRGKQIYDLGFAIDAPRGRFNDVRRRADHGDGRCDYHFMKIRRAKSADVPRLVVLNRALQDAHAEALPKKFRRDVPEEVVARAFVAMMEAASSHWLVAEVDEKIAGFLSGEFREREESWCVKAHRVCYLAAIVVAPEFRRRGIARALLEELKREVAARGVDFIELDVWAFNEEAWRAFAKLGFERVMERMMLAAGNPNQARLPEVLKVRTPL